LALAQTLTPQQKQEFLDAHNAARCDAGAVNMPALVWDDNVASVAQAWANQCNFTHNPGIFSLGLGENIAAGASSPAAVVGLWTAEKAQFNPATNTCSGSTCGHYTQV